MYTKPTSNGATVVPQNPPAFRIAPVSSQLINAAARRRDPRLRKIEQEETKTINNCPSAEAKDVKTVSSVIPNDIKSDQQNGLYIKLFRVSVLISNIYRCKKSFVLYKYEIQSSAKLVINLLVLHFPQRTLLRFNLWRNA